MERVTYYAIFDFTESRERPGGVARRRVVDGLIYDEVFTRRSVWEPTEYFERYRLGHRSDEHAEITEAEVQAYIDRTEEYLGRHPEERDIVTVVRPERMYRGRPRYPGDGLPGDW